MADGSIIKRFKDGKTIIRRSDGVVIEKKPDGTIVTKKQDGTIFKEFPDGSVEKKDPDGTTYTQKSKDDPIIIKRTDGTQEQMDGALNQPRDLSFSGFKTFLIVLIAVLILGVVAYFISKTTLADRKVEEEGDTQEAVEEKEDIHQIDFKSMLNGLIASQDYRKAIRYLFLHALKQMSDKKLIDWEIDKTNKEYYYEIERADLSKEYMRISNIYDYVWYGRKAVDQDQFQTIHGEFNKFYKKIK